MKHTKQEVSAAVVGTLLLGFLLGGVVFIISTCASIPVGGDPPMTLDKLILIRDTAVITLLSFMLLRLLFNKANHFDKLCELSFCVLGLIVYIFLMHIGLRWWA